MIREALTVDRLRAMEPDEAAAWFVARRAEGLTQSEQDLLARWLGEDRSNAVELARVERAWRGFDGAGDHELLSAMRAHALEPRRQPSWWRSPAMAAAAAALILLIGAAALLLGSPAPWAPAEPGAAAIRYASAGAEVKSFALPDGSRLTLAGRSAAIGRFDGAGRSLELVRGRAFFEVRPDRTRPFAVTAGDRRVVALGTRFDVSLGSDSLVVTLLDGRVTVGPVAEPARTVALEPGQQLVERGGRSLIRTLGRSVEEAGSWRSGLLQFDDEPLSAAIAEVNRFSKVELVIDDPEVASLRISGAFRAADSERFARTVAELHPLRPVRRDGKVALVAAR